MTVVMLEQDDRRCVFSVCGHAPRMAGMDGNPLCAAVSILCQTLRQTIQQSGECAEYAEAVGDGQTYCVFTGGGCQVNGAVGTVLTGFMLLQSKYPDKIAVLIK